jgi:F-type H+-transporting ATPase subunit a
MIDTLLTLAAADPASHVYNHYGYKSAGGYWLWSGNQGNLLLSALILIFGFKWVVSKIETGPESEGNRRFVPRNPLAHMIEVICVYLRDGVAEPLLHERARTMMPFLWTIFFFILVNNLLGLVPLLDVQHVFARLAGEAEPHWALVGGTATQNIWVTGVLAVIAGVFFNLSAIRRLGVGGYFKHMTAGSPFYVAPLIFVLEFAGQVLIKPTALALRLFANMTAGHILLATLFSFAGAVWGKGLLIQGPVTLVSVVGGFAVMMLELFVAFLQAFVFMFLTTVFISLMDHHGEEHEGHGAPAGAHH